MFCGPWRTEYDTFVYDGVEDNVVSSYLSSEDDIHDTSHRKATANNYVNVKGILQG